MRAGKDRKPNYVDVLLEGGVDDLLGREADALIDDLHPDVAGPDRDLLGPVRMPVEPRFADENLDTLAEHVGDGVDPAAHPGQQVAVEGRPGRGDAGRRVVVAEHVSQGRCPLAGARARLRALDRRRHHVAALVPGRFGELLERTVDGPLAPLGPPALERFDALPLDLRLGREDAAVRAGGEGRVLGLGEAVLADHLELPRLDPRHALAVGLDQSGLHVRHRFDRAAVALDHRHLLRSAARELVGQPLHHLRALEDVGVVEQVGLVGEDLLDPQAPLLVPGPRQPQGLVPGGELDYARPGLATERYREGFERDALDVVLRLLLRQPQRVDLDAVPQPEVLRLGDGVALAADLLPQPRYRAQP